jgi:hypothetical protein
MNNSSNGQLTGTPRSAPDSPVMTETLRRLRTQTPAESLGLPAGSGLMVPFLQAAVITLTLLALLTVVPYFVDPPKQAEAKNTPTPAEKQDPADAPKAVEPPSKAGTEPVAGKLPAAGPKAPGNKSDILDKLGENATKTASPRINPLDKKDDDILKDLK